MAGLTFGVIFAVPLVLRYIPLWQREAGIDDVKNLPKKLSNLKKYNPLRYVDINKGCFAGICDGNPLYIPWRKVQETNIQVLGATGSGKGILISLVAYQCSLLEGATIWFDPKFDRYSPRILRDAARKAGKSFIFINLNLNQPPQINLLKGAGRFDVEELLIAGFDLRCKGTDGDFYRGKDEDAAILLSNIMTDNNICSLAELIQSCGKIKEITDQENFWRHLRKLADIQAINTSAGIDLAEALNNGSIIYIVGSCDCERTKMLQKMFLIRIIQLIKQRDRFRDNKHISIILDEFKHILSTPAINALATVRDFNAHFILAHQSLGDLQDCPGIEPAAAHGAVIDNTAIKFIYRTSDSNYADQMAKLGGTKRTFIESVSSSDQIQSNERLSRGWHEMQMYHISPDLLTHLSIPSDNPNQAAVGVVFGVGTAKLFHLGPIPTQGPMPQVVAAAPSSTSREELI